MRHCSIVSGDGCGHPAVRQLHLKSLPVAVSASAGPYNALRWLVCQLWCIASAQEFVLYYLHLAKEGVRPQESRAWLRTGLTDAVGVGSTPALEADKVAAAEGRVAVAWGCAVEGVMLNLTSFAMQC